MSGASNEVVVVGAGLSGLTAALNLARDCREVLVLEKYDRVGGDPAIHPTVDITPLETGPLGRFIGVELKEPQVTPCRSCNVYFYEYKVPIDLTYANLQCIERGSRDTALDKLLYDLCLEAGVKFEFNRPLEGRGDYAQLPPGSIIAAGLDREAYKALDIPCQRMFGYLGRGSVDRDALCGVWFVDCTLDYAYYCTTNGVICCLYFAREPLKQSEWEDFKHRRLKGQEDMECARWDHLERYLPTAVLNNPRLFAGDMILAGTLAGMIDPFALFGAHGSLLSGRIAAVANRDRAGGYSLFRRYTSYFNRNLIIRKIFDATPVAYRKRFLGRQVRLLQHNAWMLKMFLKYSLRGIPGYTYLPE